MRRLLSIASLTIPLLLSGCGPATGIQEGMPKDASLPPGFDPGGDSKPDMSGKQVAPSKK